MRMDDDMGDISLEVDGERSSMGIGGFMLVAFITILAFLIGLFLKVAGLALLAVLVYCLLTLLGIVPPVPLA
jgi:hypothetical protein